MNELERGTAQQLCLRVEHHGEGRARGLEFEDLRSGLSLACPGRLPSGSSGPGPQNFPLCKTRHDPCHSCHLCKHLQRDPEGWVASLLTQGNPGWGFLETWHIVLSVGLWPGLSQAGTHLLSSLGASGTRGNWQCSFIHQILQTCFLQGTALWLRHGPCSQGPTDSRREGFIQIQGAANPVSLYDSIYFLLSCANWPLGCFWLLFPRLTIWLPWIYRVSFSIFCPRLAQWQCPP